MSTPKRIKLDPPALALIESDAAAALAMGQTFFREHVMPEIRAVRLGAKVLYPVAELERWLVENAKPLLADERAA